MFPNVMGHPLARTLLRSKGALQSKGQACASRTKESRRALAGSSPAFCLVRERARAELELHHQRARPGLLRRAGRARMGCVDAFDVRRRPIAGSDPEAAALPADLRIVDSAVEAL